MKTLIDIYKKISEQDGGARFYQGDFHIHTPMTGDWKGDSITILEWLEKLKGLKYDFAIVADHGLNITNFLDEYNSITDKGLYPTIFIGSEIQTKDRIHLHFIFENLLDRENYSKILNGYRVSEDIKSEIEDKADLELINQTKKDKISILFPHASMSKGFVKVNKGHSKEIILDGNIKLINLPNKSLKFDSNTPPKPKIPHPDCNLIKLENRKENTGYPQFLKDIKKKLAIIKISDAHSISELEQIAALCLQCNYYDYCFKGINWVKLGDLTITGIKQLHYDSKNRIKYLKPSASKYIYIIGLNISEGFFKDQYFHFNPWFNILMGGRGSGKSLIIEIIKCMLKPNPTSFMKEIPLLSHKFACTLHKDAKIRLFINDSDENVWMIERFVEKIEKKKNPTQSNISFSKRKFFKLNTSGEMQFNEVKDNIPQFSDYFEIKCQTEITELAKNKSFSISLLDNYIKEKKLRAELENLQLEFKNKKKEISNQYETTISLILEKIEYKQNFEVFFQTNKNIQREKQKSTTLDELLSEKKKWTNSNETFTKLEENLTGISEILSDPLVKMVFPKFDSPDEFLDKFNQLFKDYDDFYKKIEVKKDKLVQENLKFQNKFSKFKNQWNSRYSEEIKDLNDKISGLGQSNVNELEDINHKLEERIKDSSDIFKRLRTQRKLIKKIESELIKINSAIHQNHIETKKERKKTAKVLKKVLGKKYSINVRNKNTLDFENYLKKEYGKNLRIDDQILKLGPNLLFKEFLEDQDLSKINPNRSYKIYVRLKESVNTSLINEDSDKELILTNLKRLGIKMYDQKLLSLPEIDYPDSLDLRIKKGMQYKPLAEGSMGEIIGTLLNLLVQVQDQILIVDQPDAELDFDSLKILIKIILKMKSEKQIIFATHNPNLPALGDADQIFFLKQIGIDNEDGFTEQGIIESSGGFEKMIKQILKLEGGKKAIRNRIDKYLLF